MVSRKKHIQPLPQEMLEQLQKETPNIILLPMSEEEFAKGTKTLQKLHDKEKKYPILKATDDSWKLFRLREQLNRAQMNLTHELDYMPITAAIQNWLIGLNEMTQTKYASYMTDLISRKAIPGTFSNGEVFSVGGLRHIEHTSIIQYIEQISDLSDAAKNARIECYISFTLFLERMTTGWFKRALPISSKKYSSYRSSIKTKHKALSLEEWNRFIELLARTNYRDCLIALVMFYGAVRASDVLPITMDQLNFEKGIIRFPIKKGSIIHEKPIKYPDVFMKLLKKYIALTSEQRKDDKHLFITRNGKPLTRSRLNYSFAHTSSKAKIKKVSPDIIRATWLTLKQQNIKEEELISIIKTDEVTLKS